MSPSGVTTNLANKCKNVPKDGKYFFFGFKYSAVSPRYIVKTNTIAE